MLLIQVGQAAEIWKLLGGWQIYLEDKIQKSAWVSLSEETGLDYLLIGRRSFFLKLRNARVKNPAPIPASPP